MIAAAPAATGRPDPIGFDGCFGWLHRAGGAHGVVLCGPIGHEELAVHRGWHSLAERLAASGMPTLRFDYPGTGDSAGREDDPERIARWVESIAAAASFLRRHCGVRRISLVGLRFGATLAALAAPAIEDIAWLACLSPVVSGRLYLREMRLLANAWWDQAAPDQIQPEAPPGCLDVIGYRWDSESIASLGRINLKTQTVWPPRVVLMEAAERGDLTGLAEAVRAAGADVRLEEFPGATDFLQDPLRAETPEAAFERLCAVLCTEPSTGEPAEPALAAPAYALHLPGLIETAHWFGPGQALFGILCTPAAPAMASAAMLMLNTGLTHRVGHGRLSVTLARELALQGVCSLRMDVSGIGDSALLPGQTGPRLHDPQSALDVAAGLDLLQAQGHGHATVFGLCSGSYQAFHAARSDRRIRAIVLVNLQKFIWLGGQTLNVSYDGNRRATGVYVRAGLQWRNWLRAFRGDVHVGRIGFDLARRMLRKWRHSFLRALERATGIETGAGQLWRWMRALSERGVRIHLIYSSADPGLADLHFHLSPARLSRSFSNISLDILPDADHCLNIQASREQLGRILAARRVALGEEE